MAILERATRAAAALDHIRPGSDLIMQTDNAASP